jgi:hypothetical protein
MLKLEQIFWSQFPRPELLYSRAFKSLRRFGEMEIPLGMCARGQKLFETPKQQDLEAALREIEELHEQEQKTLKQNLKFVPKTSELRMKEWLMTLYIQAPEYFLDGLKTSSRRKPLLQICSLRSEVENKENRSRMMKQALRLGTLGLTVLFESLAGGQTYGLLTTVMGYAIDNLISSVENSEEGKKKGGIERAQVLGLSSAEETARSKVEGKSSIRSSDPLDGTQLLTDAALGIMGGKLLKSFRQSKGVVTSTKTLWQEVKDSKGLRLILENRTPERVSVFKDPLRYLDSPVSELLNTSKRLSLPLRIYIQSQVLDVLSDWYLKVTDPSYDPKEVERMKNKAEKLIGGNEAWLYYQLKWISASELKAVLQDHDQALSDWISSEGKTLLPRMSTLEELLLLNYSQKEKFRKIAWQSFLQAQVELGEKSTDRDFLARRTRTLFRKNSQSSSELESLSVLDREKLSSFIYPLIQRVGKKFGEPENDLKVLNRIEVDSRKAASSIWNLIKGGLEFSQALAMYDQIPESDTRVKFHQEHLDRISELTQPLRSELRSRPLIPKYGIPGAPTFYFDVFGRGKFSKEECFLLRDEIDFWRIGSVDRRFSKIYTSFVDGEIESIEFLETIHALILSYNLAYKMAEELYDPATKKVRAPTFQALKELRNHLLLAPILLELKAASEGCQREATRQFLEYYLLEARSYGPERDHLKKPDLETLKKVVEGCRTSGKS